MFLITIAIPTFNNEATIKRTIESCLEQTDLKNVEILVINNASKDETSKILANYDKKIRIITNESTVSLFENHNVALKNAKSEYILFCHSDDTLYPDAIKTLKKKLEERGWPKKYVCWGHSMFRDFYPALLNCNFTTGQAFSGIHATNPFLEGGLTPSGTCYSADFREIGGFLPTQHRLAPSDATSMINAALHGFKFEMMQDIIFKRTTASTLTRTTNKNEADAGFENAFSNLLSILDKSTILDILSSSNAMRSVPVNFLRASSKVLPKESTRRLLLNSLRRPRTFFRPEFFKAIYFSIKNILNAAKS